MRIDAHTQRTAVRNRRVEAFSEGFHRREFPLPCQVAATAAAIPAVMRAMSVSPVTYGGMV
jgi:hypothetical protein